MSRVTYGKFYSSSTMKSEFIGEGKYVAYVLPMGDPENEKIYIPDDVDNRGPEAVMTYAYNRYINGKR